MESTRIVSWNVAGLYASIQKGFCDAVKKLDPDIMLIQETKTWSKKPEPPEIEKELGNVWKYRYYHDATNIKGYAGKILLRFLHPKK